MYIYLHIYIYVSNAPPGCAVCSGDSLLGSALSPTRTQSMRKPCTEQIPTQTLNKKLDLVGAMFVVGGWVGRCVGGVWSSGEGAGAKPKGWKPGN